MSASAPTATSAPSRERTITFVVFGVMAVLFIMVGHYRTDANVDVIATNGAAWQLAVNGTLEAGFLVDETPWIVEDKNGRLVSDRTPGLIGTALPAYLVVRPRDFTNGPGTFMAMALSLGSVFLIFLLIRRELGFAVAIGASVVLGLGTMTWVVSAQELWPHGPGQFWGAVALTAAASRRYWWAGAAYAAAILVRPVTAVAAAAIGISEAVQQKMWRPMVQIGLTSSVGFVLLIAYNRWLFGGGGGSIGGGQAVPIDEGTISRYGATDYLENLYEMFIGWPNGFLIWSPIVAISAIGTISVWKRIPTWARSGAIAGLSYLVVHAALNRASGGAPLFYRYPLEAITLAAPALTWGAVGLWKRNDWMRRAVFVAAAVSIAVAGYKGFYSGCITFSDQSLSCFWH